MEIDEVLAPAVVLAILANIEVNPAKGAAGARYEADLAAVDLAIFPLVGVNHLHGVGDIRKHGHVGRGAFLGPGGRKQVGSQEEG